MVKLTDTTLCAIVRDEIMNPAGGIRDFVDSTVPFVEEAVIVDTGSVDGTKEVLRELEAKYPNLRVFDSEFRGYPEARNTSISFARTKRAFILDADERLTRRSFEKINEFVARNPDDTGYNFDFLMVPMTGKPIETSGLNPRLFTLREDVHYGLVRKSEPLECLYQKEDGRDFRFEFFLRFVEGVKILHFVPSVDALMKKKREWYAALGKENGHGMIPSSLPSFPEWKSYNPRRRQYA